MSNDSPPLLTAEMAKLAFVHLPPNFHGLPVGLALVGIIEGKTECRVVGGEDVAGLRERAARRVAMNAAFPEARTDDDYLIRDLAAALERAAPPLEQHQAVGLPSSPTQCAPPRSCEGSVPLTTAEPSESAVLYGFESVSAFRDSELFEEMSGCRGAALAARICWRAMNECRRVEQAEWYSMLTDEDRRYTFGESPPSLPLTEEPGA